MNTQLKVKMRKIFWILVMQLVALLPCMAQDVADTDEASVEADSAAIDTARSDMSMLPWPQS